VCIDVGLGDGCAGGGGFGGEAAVARGLAVVGDCVEETARRCGYSF